MSQSIANQNFETLKFPLFLPKPSGLLLEFITFITNRTKDDLFTRFIIDELIDYFNNFEEKLISIIKESRIFKQLGKIIRQYYGREEPKKNLNNKKKKFGQINDDTIEITIFLPKKLMNLVDKICKISKNSRIWFFNDLIFTRLDYIYSDPEVLCSYINYKSGIYKELREGIEDYYEDEIVFK